MPVISIYCCDFPNILLYQSNSRHGFSSQDTPSFLFDRIVEWDLLNVPSSPLLLALQSASDVANTLLEVRPIAPAYVPSLCDIQSDIARKINFTGLTSVREF